MQRTVTPGVMLAIIAGAIFAIGAFAWVALRPPPPEQHAAGWVPPQARMNVPPAAAPSGQ